MASKDVAMRCAGITCLLLFLSPVYINAAPGDDAADPLAGPSSISSQNVQPPLLSPPAGTNSSALISPIFPLSDSADSIEATGRAEYPPSIAQAPSSPIAGAAPATQVVPELPKIQLTQDSSGAVTPPPTPYVYLPGLNDDSDSVFTASSNGFNYPFMVSIPLNLAVITGTRVLPESFQPQFAARFPSVGQAGSIISSGIELGLGYSPGGFGTFGLNYRILSGLTKVYYVTASGTVDPLVAQYVNPADNTTANIQAGYVPPPTVTVSDAVGSCIVASHFTLNQMDLTYQSPILPLGIIGVFAEFGSRGAVFYREDYTNSATVFQQAKSTDAGFGPFGGLGLTLLLGKGQLYVKADGGNLFSWAHQLDREMVTGTNNGTQIQAAEMNGFHGVPMLGVEVGALFYEGPYLTIGVKYRFDQWWGLDNLGGSAISWDSNGIQAELRWRY